MFKNKFRARPERKNKSGKRKPRYWILSVTTVGVLIAYTVGNSRALNIAHVKEGRAAVERIFKFRRELWAKCLQHLKRRPGGA